MKKHLPKLDREKKLALAQQFAQRLANLTKTNTCLFQHRTKWDYIYQIEGWPIANAKLLGTYIPQEEKS